MLSICADAYYGLITSHKGRGNVPECSKRVFEPLIYLRYEGFFNIFQHNSEFYSPESYTGFRYNDPLFSVKWPAEPSIISEKDLMFDDFDPSSI